MNSDCDLIINYGTAGALNKELIGELSLVGLVRQRDMDARPISDLGVTPFEQTPFAGDIVLNKNGGAVLSTGDNIRNGRARSGK